MKTLIVTPMMDEFDAFLRSCTRYGFKAEAGMVGKLPSVGFPALGVTLARGGVGKAQFALQCQHLLDSFEEVDLLVCCGCAGALAEDLSVGDVVVGTATVEHDYNNKFNQRPIPSFPGAPMTITGLRKLSSQASTFKVHFGTIASGDEDVINVQRRKSLHKLTGALVVAWEGAGGARACKFSDTPFVEIRGVTDIADQNAPSDFEANLEVAMTNVAALIISWIAADLSDLQFL